MKIAADRYAVAIAYFLIYVVWGSTYYFIGVALEGVPTFLLGALRFSVAGAVLLLLCYIRGEKVFNPTLVHRSAISGVDMAVIMLAQRYINSSLVAIVASSTAIWITLFDVPMWRRNFRHSSTLGGLLLGFAGVAMLYMEQLDGESALVRQGEYGILILIAGCISWSLGTLYAKYRSSVVEEVNGFAGSAWQMLFASLMFWICFGLSGEWSATNLSETSGTAWLALLYLIVFGSLFAYSAYVWLLKVRPATEVATHAYVNPVVAVIIGGLGGEEITMIQLAGLAVILVSVMLVNRKDKKYA